MREARRLRQMAIRICKTCAGISRVLSLAAVIAAVAPTASGQYVTGWTRKSEDGVVIVGYEDGGTLVFARTVGVMQGVREMTLKHALCGQESHASLSYGVVQDSSAGGREYLLLDQVDHMSSVKDLGEGQSAISLDARAASLVRLEPAGAGGKRSYRNATYTLTLGSDGEALTLLRAGKIYRTACVAAAAAEASPGNIMSLAKQFKAAMQVARPAPPAARKAAAKGANGAARK
jgi:hypothetical protein